LTAQAIALRGACAEKSNDSWFALRPIQNEKRVLGMRLCDPYK